MDDKYLNLLIEKFWNGSASEEEILYLYDFLENSDEVKDKFYAAFQQSGADDHLLQQKRGEEILKTLGREIKKRTKNNISVFHFVKYKKMIGWAAVITFIFMSAVTFEIFKNEKAKKSNRIASIIKIDTISNLSNNIKQITLPDKSTVLLYPESSICFEHTFQKRNIRLKGKASFRVVHDEKNIFSVTTGEIVTTDIGTEFEIDALKKERIVIHLLKGKIKVGKTSGSKLAIQDMFMDNGETVKINAGSGKFVLIKPRSVKKPETPDYTKPLVFDKTPLDMVFNSIAQKYNVKITFNRKTIAKLTFTGNIEPGDSLLNVLNTICYMNDLHFNSEDNGYTISRD